MATDELIASLVRDLKPVRPLALPRARFADWGLIVGVTAAIVAAAIGLRLNFWASLSTIAFQAHIWLLAVCAATAAGAALMLAVPGERVSWWRRLAPVTAGSAWLFWLFVELRIYAMSGAGLEPGWSGVACVAKAVAFSGTPGIALMIMLGRGAPPDARATLAFGGLAAAAVGALGVELTCPLTSPSHLLVWHAGPVVAAVIASQLLGRAMLNAIARVVGSER